jgi:hypothetical protein
VALASGDQVLDFSEWSDVAARADSSAVKSGGGTGEFELALQRPTLQQPVDETGVEDVAGSSGIDGVNEKRGA